MQKLRKAITPSSNYSLKSTDTNGSKIVKNKMNFDTNINDIQFLKKSETSADLPKRRISHSIVGRCVTKDLVSFQSYMDLPKPRILYSSVDLLPKIHESSTACRSKQFYHQSNVKVIARIRPINKYENVNLII